MAERNQKIRLGGFVALAGTALTVLVVLFGGTPRVFSSRTEYVVMYTEAPGVVPGTPVRKSGVRIGQVKGIDIDEATGQVRVNVEVENKYLPRQNEEPAISRGLLSGDTTIDFIPRTDSKGQPVERLDYYPANTEIAGVPPINPRALLNQAQGTIPTAAETLNRLNTTLGGFERVGPKAVTALDEISEFMKVARQLVPELRETNKKVQEFIGQNEVPNPNDPLAKPVETATLKTLLKEVQDFVKAYKPLSEDLRALLKNNEQEFGRALKSVRELSDKAGGFLNDENGRAFSELLRTLQTAAGDLLTEENRKNIAAILRNVRDGSDDLTKTIRLAAILVDRADTTLKELTATAKEFNARSQQAKGVLENIDKSIKPIAENAEPVMKNVASAAESLSSALAEAKKTLAMVNKSDGSLSKVLNDPQLYNQLVDAAANLNRTLIRAEKIAKDLEVFADKVARKPEMIGIGGALRPSTGLKEAPTAPLGPIPYPRATGGSGNGIAPIAPVPSVETELLPIPPVSSFKAPPTPGATLLPVKVLPEPMDLPQE
jgi:phospholipid/cholesterol/gamma-HCH transport system substrate-binding protein